MNKFFINKIKLKTFLTAIAPFIFYAVVFFVLTYPLIFNFSSAIVGAKDSDAPVFFWNAWHFEKNIMHGDLGLVTNDLLFPTQPSLVTHTYTQLHSAIVTFFNIFFNNLVLSFNFVFLLFSVLNAYFAYRFFLLLTNSKISSLLAGQLFAFQAMWSIYVMFGTQNLLSIWFIPAALYFYELYRKKRKIKFGIIAGIVLGLSLINGFYPFAFSLVGLVVYSLLRVVLSKKESFVGFLKGVLYVLIGFLVSAGWKIVLLFQNLEYSSSLAIPSVSDVDFYHADLMNILRPVQFHPWWGGWSSWFSNVSITNGNSFLGFTVIFIIILFVYRLFQKKIKVEDKKIVNLFLVGYVIVLFLSFGPMLHIFGHKTGIYMPHYFIQKIFVQLNNLRVPMRWLLLGQIFISGVVVYLLKYIFGFARKNIQYILFVGLSIGLIIDVAFLPRQIIKIDDVSTRAYEQIKNEEDGTVLNIPLEINNGFFTVGETSCMSMIYQTIHEQPIIGGRLSRMEQNIQEYSKQPVIKYLLNPIEKSPDKYDVQLKNIYNFNLNYQIKYISIDKKYIDPYSENGEVLIRYLKNELGYNKNIFEDEYFLVFSK